MVCHDLLGLANKMNHRLPVLLREYLLPHPRPGQLSRLARQVQGSHLVIIMARQNALQIIVKRLSRIAARARAACAEPYQNASVGVDGDH